MGIKNYLIEGFSGSGKTSVCKELKWRNYHAINGDCELAYQGNSETGEPLNDFGLGHEHHIWDVNQVKFMIADQSNLISFFCGGSRNFIHFIDLFDGVFVLEADLDTLKRRLAARPEDEWGGKLIEWELVARLYATKENIPKNGITIDATRSIDLVVNEILEKCK